MRGSHILAAALVLGVVLPTSPTLGSGRVGPVAQPNAPFTLRRVDPCFLVPSLPGGTVWPISPVTRAHAIRGSFNEPRSGSAPHFGVDVQALSNEAPVYAVSSGRLRSVTRPPHHSLIDVGVQNGRFLQYWHVLPLQSLHAGMQVRPGQLIGHVKKGYYHVHLSEFYASCGWINPMRPSGPLYVGANIERPQIGRLRAYIANSAAFQSFDTGRNPNTQTDPSTPLRLSDLHGVVDLRSEIWDWPHKMMVGRPQLALEPAAIRAYLAPRFNPYKHVSRMKHVYDGATLLRPARQGTTTWHIWAFGTWRQSSGYFDSGPNANAHLGAAYVWHVGGVSGLHTNEYRNGAYQYCVEALTINGRGRARCTPVVINN